MEEATKAILVRILLAIVTHFVVVAIRTMSPFYPTVQLPFCASFATIL